MSLVPFYGPQVFVDGTFSKAGAYQSTSYGGGNAPITGYPEIAAGENFETVAGTGPAGENIVDAVNTADYTSAGIAMLSLGPLANGQFDCRGPVYWTWKMKPLASALDEAGVNEVAILTNGGASGTGGLFSSNIIIEISQQQSAGANFAWELAYFRPTTPGDPFSGFTRTATSSATGTIDDAWHEYQLKVTPSTVTGAYSATAGLLGTADLATDGAIEFTQDGSVIYALTGLRLAINRYATTNPEVYYGKGIWHGFSDLPGPLTADTLSYDAGAAIPFEASTPCCGDRATPGATGGGSSSTGSALGLNPYEALPAWTPACAGGGTVPTAADETDSESWAV